MKQIIKNILILASLIFATHANATIYTGEVDSDAYVTFGGYDLAWASPCSDGGLEGSCGPIDMSEQAGYGWAVMDSVLFAELGISAATFAVDYVSANTTAYNGINYAGASGWFSNDWTHIDVTDGLNGYWSFIDVADNACCYETIVYRVSGGANSVPEPSSVALLGLSLLGLIGLNRRKA